MFSLAVSRHGIVDVFVSVSRIMIGHSVKYSLLIGWYIVKYLSPSSWSQADMSVQMFENILCTWILSIICNRRHRKNFGGDCFHFCPTLDNFITFQKL